MNVSLLLALFILSVGSYLLVKLRFFFILHPIKTVTAFVLANRSQSARRSLMLALAGTLGVGNIFGVAAGIIYGGAGTVFWLAVSAIFSAVIKYAECILSGDGKLHGKGGMHLAIRQGYKRYGLPLSYVYAAACLFLSLFMGAAMQSSAVADTFRSLWGINTAFPGVIFSILVLFGVYKGVGKIEKITEKIIPLTTIIYISLSIIAILWNFQNFCDAMFSIIKEAFVPKAASVGIGGGVLLFGFSEGFARGVMSNEAGCGTSTFAHTRNCNGSAHSVGLCGMYEVYFDTSVLCVLTGVAILCSIPDTSIYSSPMMLVSDALGGTLGSLSHVLLLFSITAFAYSTVVCWFYYGRECAGYLFAKKGNILFFAAFFIFLLFGEKINGRTLIQSVDLLLLILSVLTISLILHKRKRIVELSVNSI